MKHLLLNKEIPNDVDYSVVAYNTTTNKVTYQNKPKVTIQNFGIPNSEIWYEADSWIDEPSQSYDFGSTIINHTFRDCKGILTFDGNVTQIPEYVFMGSDFTKITLPETLTDIQSGAIAYCQNLITINYNGTIEQWNNISKQKGWNTDIPATTVTCIDGNTTL